MSYTPFLDCHHDNQLQLHVHGPYYMYLLHVHRLIIKLFGQYIGGNFNISISGRDLDISSTQEGISGTINNLK